MSVAGDHKGIDREDLVAGSGEGLDKQAVIGLNSDGHIGGLDV